MVGCGELPVCRDLDDFPVATEWEDRSVDRTRGLILTFGSTINVMLRSKDRDKTQPGLTKRSLSVGGCR